MRGTHARGFCFSDSLEEEAGFVWAGSHLLQEIQLDGRYIYIYTNLDSYDPLAQVRDRITEDGEGVQQAHYFHCNQIGIPREMSDDEGKLVSFLQKKMKILVFFSLIFLLKSGKRILNLKNLKTG